MKKSAGGGQTADPIRKRATLRTISQLTGLSQSTVSLSLRGGTALKEETRRRVAEAAAQLGYIPDRAGVRLRTGKTNVIALVLDGGDGSIDFARHLIAGISRSIKDTRYHMTVIPEFQRGSVDSVRYIIENRTADGVILTHTSVRDPRVQLLMDHGFPFVTHGRTEFYSPHAFHDFHSEVFAQLAVERLAQKGVKRLMLVIGGDKTTNYNNIVSTFERTATRLKLETEIFRHQTERSDAAEMRQFGRELAARADRPDGIICDSEMRTICMISGLMDGGVQVNKDMHFICKQTSDVLPTLFPMLDTIEEDVVAAGVELTRLLIRRINGEPAEDLRTLGEPEIHWRS